MLHDDTGNNDPFGNQLNSSVKQEHDFLGESHNLGDLSFIDDQLGISNVSDNSNVLLNDASLLSGTPDNLGLSVDNLDLLDTDISAPPVVNISHPTLQVQQAALRLQRQAQVVALAQQQLKQQQQAQLQRQQQAQLQQQLRLLLQQTSQQLPNNVQTLANNTQPQTITPQTVAQPVQQPATPQQTLNPINLQQLQQVHV